MPDKQERAKPIWIVEWRVKGRWRLFVGQAYLTKRDALYAIEGCNGADEYRVVPYVRRPQ